MDDFATWCGFVGVWLLVAGPIYQAALELDEQQVEHDQIAAAAATVDVPPPVSVWWWLLPPVRYWLERRRRHAFGQAMYLALPRAQQAQLLRYLNKATGWLFVAVGASFIAVKETLDLGEQFGWPTVWIWILIVVMGALCAVNTIVRLGRTRKALAGNLGPGSASRSKGTPH